MRQRTSGVRGCVISLARSLGEASHPNPPLDFQGSKVLLCYGPRVRELAEYLQKQRHHRLYPRYLFPAPSRLLHSPSICLCPYCSFSFSYSLPLSLKVTHMWGVCEGGVG